VYQVRYYDGKVAQQVVAPGPVQGVEKVGVGVVEGVQQQQQGKIQQYYGVSPGVVPVGGNYIYVQVPYPVQQQYVQGQGQVGGYPYVGSQVGVGGYPCPVEYVYVYDGTYNRQRPVGQGVQVGQGVAPGVVQPIQGQQQQVQGSPVTYTNRVRPPQFSPQVQQQQQQVGPQQQQVPVGVVPIPVPSVYDYYYGNGGQFGYYPGVGQSNPGPYYPHYYNPVVSPSSDYFYYVQKPVGISGDKQTVQVQQQSQVVSPTEGSKKQE